jgi:hypothetical protein
VAQKTFVDGDVLTASDINTYLMGEGGAWTSYTPTVTQSGTVTCTVNYSKYSRYGRTIHWTFWLTMTGAGTGSNAVTVTLPATAASATGGVGTAAIYDSSASTPYVCSFQTNSTTTVAFVNDASGAGNWGITPATALASGDTIRGQITYEAAS